MIRRFWRLFHYVAPDLLEVGLAMLDGSYWKDPLPWEGGVPEGRSAEPDLGSWE